MTVDSYLELFTTLFGWAFYNVLWDILVASGIVFLPFLGILIDNWKEPAEGGEFGTITGLSLRRMEIEMFLALFVVTLAGQPSSLTPLNASILSYTPPPTLYEPNPASATVANSQSTYGVDGFVGSAETVNVPIWWYAVLSLTSGVNHSAIEGLPRANDLRTFEQQAKLATITDPRLRQLSSRFFTDCFVPSRSKYLREQPSDSYLDSLLDRYGPSDPEWMGSRVYLDYPGYYGGLRAAQPVRGFAYLVTRDTEYDAENPPANGRPSCYQWWTESDVGLRDRLVAAGDQSVPGFSGLVIGLVPTWAREEQKDISARSVLANAPAVWSDNQLQALNRADGGLVGSAQQLLKGSLTAGGIAISSGFLAITVSVITQALPLMQALLLLGIYALLPLIVVMSRYSLSVLVVGAIAMFTVKFWTVLWYLALWIDQNLIASMYPDTRVFVRMFSNPGEHDSKRLLLNAMTSILYLALPLLWTGMMAWVGMRVGHWLNTAEGRTMAPAQSAGRAGGQIASSAVGKLRG